MVKEMEKRLTEYPSQGYEPEPPIPFKLWIKVVMSTFAFENWQLIELLKERGTLIKAEKWDEMRATEVKVNKLKEENLDLFTRPCEMFMTFKTEEGKQRALAL
jgi:hypothetical protein